MVGADFRAEILNEVKSLFAGRKDLRVMYENSGSQIDFEIDKRPILGIEIVFNSASQADLSNRPWVIERGVVLFSVIVINNSGTLKKTQIIEELQNHFELRDFALATLGVGSQLAAADSKDGWVSYRLAIDFELHHLKG